MSVDDLDDPSGDEPEGLEAMPHHNPAAGLSRAGRAVWDELYLAGEPLTRWEIADRIIDRHLMSSNTKVWQAYVRMLDRNRRSALPDGARNGAAERGAPTPAEQRRAWVWWIGAQLFGARRRGEIERLGGSDSPWRPIPGRSPRLGQWDDESGVTRRIPYTRERALALLAEDERALRRQQLGIEGRKWQALPPSERVGLAMMALRVWSDRLVRDGTLIDERKARHRFGYLLERANDWQLRAELVDAILRSVADDEGHG